MGKSFGNWSPSTILRVIKSMKSSTQTILVETDCGEGYLKAMGNPEGPHALARELVGTLLAKRMGLPVFDFAIIDVTEDDEVPFAKGGKASPGPAFICRQEVGATLGGGNGAYILQRLDNPGDIARLIVFDTWIMNCDRHHPPERGGWQPNRDNVFASREDASEGHFVLKAIDHTHCLTFGKDIGPGAAEIEYRQKVGVFGLFPEFRPLLQRADLQRAVNELGTVTRLEVESIIDEIPPQWEVNRASRSALVDLIMLRVGFVAGNIEKWIWPEMELEFDRSAEGG